MIKKSILATLAIATGFVSAHPANPITAPAVVGIVAKEMTKTVQLQLENKFGKFEGAQRLVKPFTIPSDKENDQPLTFDQGMIHIDLDGKIEGVIALKGSDKKIKLEGQLTELKADDKKMALGSGTGDNGSSWKIEAHARPNMEDVVFRNAFITFELNGKTGRAELFQTEGTPPHIIKPEASKENP